MARRVDEWPEGVGRRREAYPFNDWLDGAVWELVPGEDFDKGVDSMRAAISSAGRRRGLKVRTGWVRPANLLFVQATGPRDD